MRLEPRRPFRKDNDRLSNPAPLASNLSCQSKSAAFTALPCPRKVGHSKSAMGSASPDIPLDGALLRRAAIAAEAALAGLPFLLLLPIDYDRVAPLAVLPALWFGRRRATDRRESALGSLDSTLLLLTLCVALVSSVTGPHPSASLVSVASGIWIVAGALLARRLAVSTAAIRYVLAGITAGATLGCLAVWTQWREGTSISAFPVYGHGRVFGLHMMVGTMTGLALLIEAPPKRLETLLTGIAASIAYLHH